MADLVSAASEDRIKLSVDVPPLLVAAQVATSLCVLAQEFVVNSLKHAFGDYETGEIRVSLKGMSPRAQTSSLRTMAAGLPDTSQRRGRTGQGLEVGRPRHQVRCVADTSVRRRDFL